MLYICIRSVCRFDVPRLWDLHNIWSNIQWMIGAYVLICLLAKHYYLSYIKPSIFLQLLTVYLCLSICCLFIFDLSQHAALCLYLARCILYLFTWTNLGCIASLLIHTTMMLLDSSLWPCNLVFCLSHMLTL